jgi:D-erythritol 1-phosphate dehydrogenase
MSGELLDLLVVGGGINGAGITRDAAGRGLKVALVEKDDLASATSGWSSKLIHGGLRYLEHYEFRLVREALREREVLLGIAPHLVRPLLFVLPHDASMRPTWMIRAGLFLYDSIGGRVSLPGSKAISFPNLEYGAGFRIDVRKAFVYSDCRVDDARLTLITAISAAERGAAIHVRTRFESARREGGVWEAEVVDAAGNRRTLRAKGIVNAAGPWVMDVLEKVEGDAVKGRVRLVKGSHIVVPKVHSQGHAWLLQNTDKRVVFVIPYQDKFSLIGTTDIGVEDIGSAREISEAETDYLIAAANRYLAKPISRADVVWSYAGVRPLYDDGTADPSAVTRDYVLNVDHAAQKAPLLTVFGGKLTTYRRLAEEAMDKLSPFYPGLTGPWTATEKLPGGDVDHFNRFRDEMSARYPELGRDLLDGFVRRHGSRTPAVLGEARHLADFGRYFGGGLTEREASYMREHEWAIMADDVLWRRTKCGLHMSAAERQAFREWFEAPR